MKLKIKSRDGAGRTGIMQIDGGVEASIPNIVYFDTGRFKPPDFAEIVGVYDDRETGCKVRIRYPEHPWLDRDIYPASMPSRFHGTVEEENQIIVPCNMEAIVNVKRNSKINLLANLVSIYPRSRQFVKNVVEIREKAGYGALLLAPGIANAQNLSLLVYMGIDLVDVTSAILWARKGMMFFPEGMVHSKDMEELSCDCPSCRKVENPGDMDFKDIMMHNIHVMNRELRRVRYAISTGRLRELVESRISSSPELVEKFRILNEEFYQFLEERTPVSRRTKLKAVLLDSLNYPEVRRFRERLLERYTKPEGARILLLLPCSAKKPYSLSKSHRKFREAILSCDNHHIVHEVIVTSPLGIVPRELENFYPADSYDIPVTGHWFEDEKRMIRDTFREYIKKNRYDAIVSHLPESLNEVIMEETGDVLATCIDNPVSKKSLDRLRDVLKDLISQYNGTIKPSERFRNSIKSMMMYQFGRKVSEELMDSCDQIKGSFPNVRIYGKGKLLASFSPDRRMFSLSMEGARFLFSNGAYTVKVAEGFDIRGSILAPGVLAADEDIRIEDEVAVVRDDRICGVGIARMNGKEMMDMNYGEAVKIRYHT